MLSQTQSANASDPKAHTHDTALNFISEATFWFPHRSSVGSGWAEHAPFAFWLIDALKPTMLVELGTHKGYSFAAFCQAIRETKIQTRCFAIDTWQGDEHAGFYSDHIYDELLASIEERYGDFARLVRSTFDDALVHFEDGSVDLLHIDGRHLYEDAVHDYSSWIPKLAPNAVVLFHDINVRERGFGVYRMWDDLKSRHPHFEFLHGNGLGVLGIGDGLPSRIQRLMDLSDQPEAKSQVQQIYSRLGKAISHHHQIAHRGPDVVGALRGGIEERDQQIIALRSEKAALVDENTVLKNDIAISTAQKQKDTPAYDPTIARLTDDLDQQAKTIRALQNALQDASAKVSEMIAAQQNT